MNPTAEVTYRHNKNICELCNNKIMASHIVEKRLSGNVYLQSLFAKVGKERENNNKRYLDEQKWTMIQL